MNKAAASILIERKGLLLAPPTGHRWWHSHAALPTVLPLPDQCWRVYFSARTAENQSHIVYADFDPSRRMRLIRVHDEPLLALGPAGSFDHTGMVPSSVVIIDGRVHLYYIGVSLRRDVPCQLAIGLAISDDGGASFRRGCPGPVMATGPHDPIFVTAGQVLPVEDGHRMWYASATQWLEINGQQECDYNIRQATSQDGIHWRPDELVALDFGDETEAGLARPWVFRRDDGFHMIYCRRGNDGFRGPSGAAYRLGYARSRDGRHWIREDARLGFDVAPADSDWDSWMQAYPCIVPYQSDLLMFYNGNGFGQSGFGYARILLR